MTEKMYLFELVMNSSFVVKIVLILLLLLSIISWAIIFLILNKNKKIQINNILFLEIYNCRENFNDVINKSKDIILSPLKNMFFDGFTELIKTQKFLQNLNSKNTKSNVHNLNITSIIQRTLQKGTINSDINLSKKLTFLASVGTIAPFIGLFGTVYGIINSFISIATNKGGASLDIVAPGVAEALITTVFGLVAAIPAVYFYNYFARQNIVISAELEAFEKEFLNDIERISYEWNLHN